MSMKRTPPPASWAEDINDWLESLKAAGLSDETVRCRRCKITKAARDLAKTPLEVTAEDMVHWMAAQKWKPESRKGYRNTLSSFYGWLYTTGRRGDDPSDELPKIKRPKPKPRPCPDKYIIAALHKATERERVMVRLAAECGLRRGEIAKVHSRDVMDDLLGKSLIITGKGDKQRIVPLPDDLADYIKLCQPAYLAVAAGRVGLSQPAAPVRDEDLRADTRPVPGRTSARAFVGGDHADLRGDARQPSACRVGCGHVSRLVVWRVRRRLVRRGLS